MSVCPYCILLQNYVKSRALHSEVPGCALHCLCRESTRSYHCISAKFRAHFNRAFLAGSGETATELTNHFDLLQPGGGGKYSIIC